jgi:hypothetical protein
MNSLSRWNSFSDPALATAESLRRSGEYSGLLPVISCGDKKNAMAPFLGSEGPAVKDAKEYDPLSGEPDMSLPQRFSAGFQL